jgi:hypothetical protein
MIDSKYERVAHTLADAEAVAMKLLAEAREQAALWASILATCAAPRCGIHQENANGLQAAPGAAQATPSILIGPRRSSASAATPEHADKDA